MVLNPFEMAFSPAETPEEVMDHIESMVEKSSVEVVTTKDNAIIEEGTIDEVISEPIKKRGRPAGSRNKSKITEGEKAPNVLEDRTTVDSTTVSHSTPVEEVPIKSGAWDDSSISSAIGTMPNVIYLHHDQDMLGHITNKFLTLCQKEIIGKAYSSEEGALEHLLLSDARTVLGLLISIWKTHYSEEFWEALSNSSIDIAGLKDKEAKAKCSDIERTISMLEYWYDSLLVRLDSMAHVDRTL